MYKPTRQDYRKWATQRRYQDGKVLVSEEDWIDLWVQSGHWLQRGKGSGKYSIRKIDEYLPSTIDNLHITSGKGTTKPRKRTKTGPYAKGPNGWVNEPNKNVSTNYKLIDLRTYKKETTK